MDPSNEAITSRPDGDVANVDASQNSGFSPNGAEANGKDYHESEIKDQDGDLEKMETDSNEMSISRNAVTEPSAVLEVDAISMPGETTATCETSIKELHSPSPSSTSSDSGVSPFKGLRELKSLLPSLLEDDWSLHFQGKQL